MVVTERPNSGSQVYTKADIYAVLAAVKDPEIPVISIEDLGILQQVDLIEDTVQVGIIPTYSGCPAMHAIKTDITTALEKKFGKLGLKNVIVKLMDKPVWNTDLISKKGREAMQVYGIAPPLASGQKAIECPQCGSENTTCISEFGSTACKALYRCESCLEPFDYFKCHV